MSELSSHSITPEAVLTLAANILYRAFFESSRIEAKQIYSGLDGGEARQLLRLAMDDDSELDVWLQLDESEYRGKLNYSGFKSHIGVLLARIKERLDGEGDANILESANGSEKLFNIPALVADGDAANVLVLGLGPAIPARLTLKLMYLDPSQFIQPGATQVQT